MVVISSCLHVGGVAMFELSQIIFALQQEGKQDSSVGEGFNFHLGQFCLGQFHFCQAMFDLSFSFLLWCKRTDLGQDIFQIRPHCFSKCPIVAPCSRNLLCCVVLLCCVSVWVLVSGCVCVGFEVVFVCSFLGALGPSTQSVRLGSPEKPKRVS